MKDDHVEDWRTRREFLTRSLRCAGLLTASPLIATILNGCGASSPVRPQGNTMIQIDVSEARFQSLATVGGVMALAPGAVTGLGGEGVFIIRNSDTTVLVLDRTCTHAGCQVGGFSSGIAECPCHGSRFNATGGVVRGPAPSALRRYAATLTGTLIEFTF